jgi:hypothetical protein
MIRWFTLAGLLLGGAVAAPFTGERLPHLQGEYLTGQKAGLPEDLYGKVALLVVAFTDGALTAARKWKSAFDVKTAGQSGVESLEVFLLKPQNRVARALILTKLRHAMTRDEERRAIVAFSAEDGWRRSAGDSEESAAYAVLLDAAGTVRGIYRATGPDERAAQVARAAAAARALRKPAKKRVHGL